MKQYVTWYALLVGLFCSVPSWAGGLWLYEDGTSTMGTAGAGKAAVGADASTAGVNPAAMILLDRSQMTGSLLGLYVDTQFDSEVVTSSGGDGGNAGGFVPAGSFSYVDKVSDDFRIGVSAGSFFGLGVDYDEDWAGRYYSTEAEMTTFTVNPGVAYRVNEWLSLGAGVSVVYGKITQKVAINNGAVPGQSGMSDGQLELDDGEVDYGFNLGLLIELTKTTRFGLTYRSEIELDFENVASLTNIGPVLQGALNFSGLAGKQVDITIRMPQSYMFSVFHQLNSEWAIMGNIGWQEWSRFGQQEISLSSQEATSFTKNLQLDDTWHFALGAQYQFSRKWLWAAGAAYDTSAVDSADRRTPDLPLDRQIRLGTGLQYQWSDDMVVGVTYEFLDAGDAEIDQQGGALKGDLVGEYDTNHVHFLGVNVTFLF